MVNVNLNEQIDEKIRNKKEIKNSEKMYKEKLINEIHLKEEMDALKKENHKNNLIFNRDFVLNQHDERKKQINKEMNMNEEKLNKTFLNNLTVRNLI